MTSGEGVSTLGVHLSEMDRLLRDIQVELAPGREPAPVLDPDAAVPDPAVPDPEPPPPVEPPAPPDPGPPPPVEPPAPPDPGPPPPVEPPPPPVPDPVLGATEDIRAAAAVSRHLLAAIRELLAGYERALIQPAVTQSDRRSRTIPDRPDVTVSAGPFATVEAVRAFETELSSLPRVREVALRGYEGTDRAVIDVRLT